MRAGRALAATALAAVALAAPAAAEPDLALVGATLIDGSGRGPLADAVVLVEDGRIAAVGRRSALGVPAAARVVDLAGTWMVPGLIDAQVHFFQSGGLYTRPDIIDLRAVRPYEEEQASVRARLDATLARYLASGVTAVLDVGGPMWNFRVRARANARLLAPRVAVAGPLLGTYAPPELATGEPPVVRIASPAQARAEVRRQLAQRPDLIKICLVLPVGDMRAELEWVRAAIDKAHAASVRVAAHATQRRAARALVEAGVGVLAHGIDDASVDEELLALMKARGVVYTPTIQVKEGYREVFGLAVELSPIERRLGDAAAIASFADLAALPRHALPAWVRRRSPAPLAAVIGRNLARVAAHGITVAAGSDAGNIGTLHGPALHRELKLMVRHGGLAPMAVLVAASLGGARAMGREAELGTIEPGKRADMVVLGADPLADIRNTRRIRLVIKGGVVLRPGRDHAARRRSLTHALIIGVCLITKSAHPS